MGVNPGAIENERRQRIAVDTMHAVHYTEAQVELDHMRFTLLQGAAAKMMERSRVSGRLDPTVALVESMRDIVAAFDNAQVQNGKAG